MSKMILGNQTLDKEQKKAVMERKNLLLVAGAGSGKTFTLIAKIKYLITKKQINPNEIICFSFTKEAVNHLKQKLAEEKISEVTVKTFHKFALDLYQERPNIEINLLEYLLEEYFFSYLKEESWYFQIICLYIKSSKEKTYEIWYQKNKQKIQFLKKEIIQSIHLIKANFLSFSWRKLYEKIKKMPKKEQNQNILLFAIIHHLFFLYQEELNSTKSKDFDDLIIDGIKNLKNASNYRYILIDEYQDISFIRQQLILQLKHQTGAKLFAVGDDYQAIYRFAGSDISLFRNFKKQVKSAKIRKLQTTYRSNQELITIAGNFIQKNKEQWSKTLVSQKHQKNPIEIIYTQNEVKTIEKLQEQISKDKTIFILGRTNEEEKTFKKLKNKKNCKFYTVHRAKGLEADIVIVLNMTNHVLGFPSLLEETNFTKFILSKKEIYPYAEERRLFYVAMTRAKEKVYLLTNRENPSIFIEEIKELRNSKKHFHFLDFLKKYDIIQTKKR